MPINQFNIRGLDSEQVKVSRERFGLNSLSYKKENNFLEALLRIVKEPMTLSSLSITNRICIESSFWVFNFTNTSKIELSELIVQLDKLIFIIFIC